MSFLGGKRRLRTLHLLAWPHEDSCHATKGDRERNIFVTVRSPVLSDQGELPTAKAGKFLFGSLMSPTHRGRKGNKSVTEWAAEYREAAKTVMCRELCPSRGNFRNFKQNVYIFIHGWEICRTPKAIITSCVGGRPPRYAPAQACKWWHDYVMYA